MSKLLILLFIIFNPVYASELNDKRYPDVTSPVDFLKKNGFEYVYYYGKLVRGSARMGIIHTEYTLKLNFNKKDYLEQILFLPTSFGYQSQIIFFDFFCKEYFEDEKYCHVKNIYNTTPKEYPELTQVKMKKSFEDVWEENTKDNYLTPDFGTQLNFLAHHLRLNNFSDEFIDQLLNAAKKKELERLN